MANPDGGIAGVILGGTQNKPIKLKANQANKTDQEVCLDAVKAYMVKNKGNATKLKTKTKWADIIKQSNRNHGVRRRNLKRKS